MKADGRKIKKQKKQSRVSEKREKKGEDETEKE